MTEKIDRLTKALQTLARHKAGVGYQGPSGAQKHPDADLPIATLAKIHEYGLGVPRRPLLRATLDANREEFKRLAKEAARAVALAIVRDKTGRKDPRSVVESEVQDAGEKALAALRLQLARSKSWALANAESTVKKKKHDQPLIGTEHSLETNASWSVIKDGKRIKQGGEQ